jgi:drug/metabolite transporter (DMT)-like permease
VLVSAAGYGSQAILARLAYAAGANVPSVLLVRFVLAAAVLWVVLVLRGRARLALSVVRNPRRLLRLLGLGLVFAVNSIAYFSALTYVRAAIASLLLYLYPGIVLVLSAILLRERPTRREIGALSLTLVGLAMTVGVPASVAIPGVGGGAAALGAVLAAGSAAGYALYIVLNKAVLAETPADLTATLTMSGAALVFLAGGVAGDGSSLALSAAALAAIAAMAVLSTVVATTLFLAGLRRLPPARAAMLATAEPVVTMALAIVTLGEVPQWSQAAGGALILLGATAVQRTARGG